MREFPESWIRLEMRKRRGAKKYTRSFTSNKGKRTRNENKKINADRLSFTRFNEKKSGRKQIKLVQIHT